MAGSIVQSAQNFSTTAGTTKAVTLTGTTAGNAIVVFAHDGSGTSKAMTCADNVNGSYGTQVDSLNDATNGNTLRSWVKGNIAGGSVTVTVSFPASDIFIGLYAAEVTGVSTAPLDGHHAQSQSVANGGAISSGAGTSTATGFTLALSVRDDTSAAGSIPSLGTGFTVDPNFTTGVWNYGSGNNALVEYKASVAAGSISAAFVNSSGSTGTFNTLMVNVDEATSGATGSAAITEGADTASGTGSVGVSGSAGITEGTDTVAGTGSVGVSGSAAITEGADTVAASGTAGASGSASITEGADAVSATGSVGVSGSAAIAEGADAVTATGSVSVSGSAAITEGADTVSASGTATTGAVGSAAISEDPDTVSATGSVGVSGSAGILEDADIVLAQGSVPTPVGFSNDPGLGGSGGDRWSSKFEFSRRKRLEEAESIETPSPPVPRGTLPIARQIDENVATQLKNALQLPPSEDEDDEEAFSMLLQAEDAIRAVAVQQLQALMGRLKQ